MKTPEQIAEQTIIHLYPAEGARYGGCEDAAWKIDREAVVGAMDGNMILGLMAEAIEADRAQREHPMSDPLIELREWASTVSQFMAEDKSNDWREEIAQLEVIEGRLDAR